MSNYSNLPAPTPEGGLNRYLQEIRKFPMLEPEEEYMLAKRWVDHQDRDAAHQLVNSHLRLAAKIAMGYRGYGLPQAEVISEANVGLMQAVKKFDPEKGFRLATYAMWQKKLFFNLRKAKSRIGALEDGDLRPENVARIASDLNVTEDEVISMNRRMSGGDASLNATVSADGEGATVSADGEGTMQWQDWLEDEDADQAGDYAEKNELDVRREMLAQAMEVLNEREADILTRRRSYPPDRGPRFREAATADAGSGRRTRLAGERLIRPPGHPVIRATRGGALGQTFGGQQRAAPDTLPLRAPYPLTVSAAPAVPAPYCRPSPWRSGFPTGPDSSAPASGRPVAKCRRAASCEVSNPVVTAPS